MHIFSLTYFVYGYGSVNVDLFTDDIKHFAENVSFNLTYYQIWAIYACMLDLRFFWYCCENQKQPQEVFYEKKVLLEISQNSQGNSCARVLFLIKLLCHHHHLCHHRSLSKKYLILMILNCNYFTWFILCSLFNPKKTRHLEGSFSE